MENKQSEKMLLIDSQEIEEKTFEFQNSIGIFYPTKTWLEAKHSFSSGTSLSGLHSSVIRGLRLMQRSSEKLQNLPYFWNHFGEDKNLKSAIKNSVGIFDVDGQSLKHGKFCWNISSSINLLFLIKFFLHDVSRTYLLLLHNSVNILYSTTLELVKLICVQYLPHHSFCAYFTHKKRTANQLFSSKI